MNIMAGSLGGLFPPLSTDQLEVLSVVVNNVCNLRCRHCYLEPLPGEPYLTPQEWLTFFHSVFAQLAPSVVSFAGKEIFADGQSADILFEAIRTRDRLQQSSSRRTHIGVITNGMLLDRFQETVLQLPPDHFDISIDGMPAVHDEVRGFGAFDRLAPNLHWLVEAFPSQVWVTHTLFAQNVRSVPEFVQYYERAFGLRQFSFGFYQPLPYTSPELALSASDRLAFLEDALLRLGTIHISGPVEIILEFGRESNDLLPWLRARGLIASPAPISSNRHTLQNGLTVRINASEIPVGLWRAVRVTPEGYWLAAEDLIDAKVYASHTIVRLRDIQFDSQRAYETGLSHPRLKELTAGESQPFLAQIQANLLAQRRLGAGRLLASASRA